MKTKQGKSVEERKHEGNMRNKWPKHARENRETFTRQMHPDHTRGTQLLKHHIVINA